MKPGFLVSCSAPPPPPMKDISRRFLPVNPGIETERDSIIFTCMCAYVYMWFWVGGACHAKEHGCIWGHVGFMSRGVRYMGNYMHARILQTLAISPFTSVADASPPTSAVPPRPVEAAGDLLRVRPVGDLLCFRPIPAPSASLSCPLKSPFSHSCRL